MSVWQEIPAAEFCGCFGSAAPGFVIVRFFQLTPGQTLAASSRPRTFLSSEISDLTHPGKATFRCHGLDESCASDQVPAMQIRQHEQHFVRHSGTTGYFRL
jgi:hypothetical protein